MSTHRLLNILTLAVYAFIAVVILLDMIVWRP